MSKEINEDAVLTIAEQVCARFIGETLNIPVHQRRIGANEGLAECMVFDLGQAYTGDLNTFRAPEIHMRAQADFFSEDRAKLQRFIMRLRRAMPANSTGENYNLAQSPVQILVLRLAPENSNPGALQPVEMQLKTDEKKINVWTFSAVFDEVFVAD